MKKDIEIINNQIKLENNQNSIVKNMLIASSIFGILMMLPFSGIEFFEKSFALSFISMWLFVSSLVIAWMFRGRAKRLQSLISGDSLLANWELDMDMKREYVDYFFVQEKEKNIAIFTVISIMATIIFGMFILVIDDGKLFMFLTLIFLILFIALFAFGMPYYYRYSNLKGDGKVLIGKKYAYINGYFHNWDFPLSGLSDVKIMKKPFNGIRIVYYYTDRTLKHSEELFIPANKNIDLNKLKIELEKK